MDNFICANSLVLCKFYFASFHGYYSENPNFHKLQRSISPCKQTSSCYIFNYPYLSTFSKKSLDMSARTVQHFAQMRNSGRFQKYDYGFVKNMELYGAFLPPEYNLSVITAPIFIYHSVNDDLSSVEDVKHLSSKLNSWKKRFLILNPDFSHIDFLSSYEARELVYNRIVDNISHE